LDGLVDEIVLTPHYRSDDGPERGPLFETRFREFADAVVQAGIDVKVHLGSELAFRFGLADLATSTPTARLAGGPFVLVDLPPGPLSPGLEQAFFEVRTAGLRPILAHPERHRELARDPQRLVQLRDQDLLLQIDAGSLRGRFGRRAQAAAIGLAESRRADFVASDGHDLERRPLSLRSAFDQVESLAGVAEAQRMFCHNPRQVIAGEMISAGEPIPPAARGRGVLRRLLTGRRDAS
jgi:protein-tyrosine phosphatase